MNVNINVMTSVASKKLSTSKQINKNEDFKVILNNHELRSVKSSNENVQKKNNSDKNSHEVSKGNVNKKDSKNLNDDVDNKDIEKHIVDSSTSKDLINSNDNMDLKEKIISLIEVAIDSLKKAAKEAPGELDDKSTEQIAQLNQLLQLLSSMVQNLSEVSDTGKGIALSNSIDLENLLDPVKNNLSEIVAMLQKSKGNSNLPSEIINVLQKLTTAVEGNLSTLKNPISGNSEDKLIQDNLLKKVIELSSKVTYEALPKSEMQNGTDTSKENKFSGSSSSEEKFLKNLLGADKDEMKISKAVNFMNQFEAAKTLDTVKVQAVNLVIDKSNFGSDVIKNIKFMEINNLKDLTVKMNPKELGEITIKLTMESGIMKASISTQNKDTYNLLNQNLQDISDKLKNMDIKIQSLDINIYDDSTFFNKNSNEKNNNNERKNDNSGTKMDLEQEDISISTNYVIEENQVNKFV